MKLKLTLTLIVICLFSISNVLSQNFTKGEFKPAIKNGAVISSSQNMLNSNLTSILIQIWIPDNWEDNGRILYNYNSNGMLTEILYDSLSNGNWKTFGSMTMEYNSNDELIKDISSFLGSDGKVEHGVKWEYEYSNSKMVVGYQSMWDIDNEIWESYGKQNYTYTGELITKIEDYDDMGDGTWDLMTETSITYDAQDREVESFERTWSSIDNEFTNSYLTTTEYYKENKISEWLSKSWDMLNEQWSEENFTLSEYMYDGNDNCIEEITTTSFGIVGFSFATKNKLTHAYDGNNFMVETIDYTWDEGSEKYYPLIKQEQTNTAEGNPQVITEYIYAGEEWVKYEKYIYNYGGTVDVAIGEELPSKMSLNQNYPNPFNPVTKISYTISEASFVNLAIYNAIGESVKTLVNKVQNPNNYEVTFDAAELSSGIYIYVLKANEYVSSKKCILIK